MVEINLSTYELMKHLSNVLNNYSYVPDKEKDLMLDALSEHYSGRINNVKNQVQQLVWDYEVYLRDCS